MGEGDSIGVSKIQRRKFIRNYIPKINKIVDKNSKTTNNHKYRIYEEFVMTNESALPETLTTRETAKLLSASVRTIQLWVEDGRLKAWKTPGGHRRVLRTSVEEMLASRKRASGGDQRKFEVLVVEDDPIQRAVLDKTLTNLGPDTHLRVSEDGYEALIRIGELRPDLLVTDLVMPGLDGFRLLKALAREASDKPMQIIVLTALSAEEVVAEGGLPNGVMLLHKPLCAASLLSLSKAYYLAWQIGSR
jgi:excisionase family DNA binding protein